MDDDYREYHDYYDDYDYRPYYGENHEDDYNDLREFEREQYEEAHRDLEEYKRDEEIYERGRVFDEVYSEMRDDEENPMASVYAGVQKVLEYNTKLSDVNVRLQGLEFKVSAITSDGRPVEFYTHTSSGKLVQDGLSEEDSKAWEEAADRWGWLEDEAWGNPHPEDVIESVGAPTQAEIDEYVAKIFANAGEKEESGPSFA